MRVWDYPAAVVIVRCDVCHREGRYPKGRFIEIVGGDTQLSSALDIIAESCPKANKPSNILHDRCKAHYPELSRKENG